MRIAVIGGGQSAAEAFIDLHDNFPSVSVDLIMRTSALKPADSSPFVNEIFAPEFTGRIFQESVDHQRKLNEEYRNTNYAVADSELIERIYGTLYRQKVVGRFRHSVLRRTLIDQASASQDGITLALRDIPTNQPSERIYDAVVLATGYERQSHRELLEPLRDFLGEMRTDRCYRVQTDANLVAPIYLQGFSEATHGLSDTLLSVLSVRSEEIGKSLHDLLSAGQPVANSQCDQLYVANGKARAADLRRVAERDRATAQWQETLPS